MSRHAVRVAGALLPATRYAVPRDQWFVSARVVDDTSTWADRSGNPSPVGLDFTTITHEAKRVGATASAHVRPAPESNADPGAIVAGLQREARGLERLAATVEASLHQLGGELLRAALVVDPLSIMTTYGQDDRLDDLRTVTVSANAWPAVYPFVHDPEGTL